MAGQFFRSLHNTHATPTTARRCFQNYWITNFRSQFNGFFRALQNTNTTWKNWNARFLHGRAGMLLKAHGAHYIRLWTNKFDAAGFAHLDEISVFAKEPISRMDGVHIGDFRSTDHTGNIQVTASTFCGTNTNRFIGKPHVQTVAICLRIHRHSFNAQFLRRANNTQGDLSTIGNQNLSKHRYVRRLNAA